MNQPESFGIDEDLESDNEAELPLPTRTKRR